MTSRTSATVEPLAREMVERWRNGDHRPVEQFLARLPHATSTRGVLELIAEEFALRQECGLSVSEGEQAERFPQWSMEVRALARWHHLFRRPVEPTFPEPGDLLGDFRLVANLGRGLAGRVYLAKQRSLADRLVVLKLAKPGDHEHLCLARLQHTHIVPLLSAHTFPERGLHALCLPYFGGTSVDRTQVTFTPAAVARLGACLADALQYAHDRDLLHLDVKPSNVLLADDGTPMLLDFHLARPPLPAGAAPPEWLGGTYQFMPPEQNEAVMAVQAGRPLLSAVDARADVYSLGKTLGWLLARTEARVPTGLADVIARASAENPADRYPSAAALADDLRRHLADQPLKGVRNRSLLERWQKWRRRQPLTLPLVLAGVAVLTAGVGGLLHLQRQAVRAEVLLHEGEGQSRGGQYSEAVATLRSGELTAAGLPLHDELKNRLRDARAAAEWGQLAAELQAVCERARGLATAEGLTAEQAASVERKCRAVWDRRELFAHPPADAVGAANVPRHLRELAVVLAELTVRSDPTAGSRAAETLDQAEQLLGSHRDLDATRERLRRPR